MEKDFRTIIITALAFAYLSLHCDGVCDRTEQTDEIRTCLQPVLEHVINANSESGTHVSTKLIEVSLAHYFTSLRDQHENEVHLDSLIHVLMPMDGMLFSGELDEACRVVQKAKACLSPVEVWCDQETRDVLDGLENAFTFVCAPEHQTVFKNNSECLGEPRTNTDCQIAFNNTITNTIQAMVTREESRLHYYNHTIAMHKPDDTTQSLIPSLEAFTAFLKNHTAGPFTNVSVTKSQHLRELKTSINMTITDVCRAVTSALICNHENVRQLCGADAARWESQLRLSLVQVLLVDLRCEDSSDFLPPSLGNQCFNCSDSQGCIDSSKVCDGVNDCESGLDESPSICTSPDDSSAIHIFYILAGVAAAALILVVIICCIVRCKETDSEEGSFSMDDAASANIVKDEESMGSSTPPAAGATGTNDDVPMRFVKYKAVPTDV